MPVMVLDCPWWSVKVVFPLALNVVPPNVPDTGVFPFLRFTVKVKFLDWSAPVPATVFVTLRPPVSGSLSFVNDAVFVVFTAIVPVSPDFVVTYPSDV